MYTFFGPTIKEKPKTILIPPVVLATDRPPPSTSKVNTQSVLLQKLPDFFNKNKVYSIDIKKHGPARATIKTPTKLSIEFYPNTGAGVLLIKKNVFRKYFARVIIKHFF